MINIDNTNHEPIVVTKREFKGRKAGTAYFSAAVGKGVSRKVVRTEYDHALSYDENYLYAALRAFRAYWKVLNYLSDEAVLYRLHGGQLPNKTEFVFFYLDD